MKRGLHVAMYLRISQEKKGENVETLTNHRNILTEYAAKNSYTYEEFSEVLSGGKSDLEDRPLLQSLLDNIEKYDAILVMELSRISRNGLISETVLQYCVDYDKPIITPEKVYDLANNSNDVLSFRFGSLIASDEHMRIGKRSKNNKISMAKQGLHVAGSVPYGYRRNDSTKKLEIYEPEAQVIRYIFQLHGEGLGSRKIVDRLNVEGYKPARSDAFQLPTVKRIIQNPAYKGTVVFQDRKRVKEGGKYTFKILGTIVCDDAHPPIVAVDEWERANRERVDRADQARQYREKPAVKTGTTMLKDLLYCGICGRKMSIKKEQNGVYSLKPCEFQLPKSAEKCTNSGVKLEHLEADVLDYLKAYKAQIEAELPNLQNQDVSSLQNELQERLGRIEAQLAENQRQQTNLIELAVAGIFSHDELKSKKQALIDQKQALEQSKEKLSKESESIDVASHIEELEQTLEMLERLEDQSTEGRNRSLKKFIKKIYFTRNIPEELKKLSTRNPARRNFPFEFEIEYF